jgi:hypothetical protein
VPKGNIICQIILNEQEIIMTLIIAEIYPGFSFLKNSKHSTYIEMYFPPCRKNIFRRTLTHQEARGK